MLPMLRALQGLEPQHAQARPDRAPIVLLPQWATRSISRKLGRASFPSAKVQIAISCLAPDPLFPVH